MGAKTVLREYVRHVLNERRPGKAPRRADPASAVGWQPWPADVRRIKFAGSTGIGEGERRLAKIFNGTVQGGNVSFDILDDQGRRWEVKKPDTAKEIRPGTEGIAAFSRARVDIEDLATALARGFKRVKKIRDLDRILSRESQSELETFISKDVPMISKGEIPKGRIVKLRKVLDTIYDILIGTGDEDVDKFVELGDEEHSVYRDIDLKTYVKTGQELDISDEELGIGSIEVFISAFSHPAFSNPQEWLTEHWDDAVSAEMVFGNTDGVILVDESRGFLVIPRERLNDDLKFTRVSQGRPRFKAAAQV